MIIIFTKFYLPLVYVCIYMYVCMHVCTCMYACIMYMYNYMYVFMYNVCMYACTCSSIYVDIFAPWHVEPSEVMLYPVGHEHVWLPLVLVQL